MIKKQIIAWAAEYETTDFILTDPIQIPKRYSEKRDIEIAAFVTSWLAYGNRKAFLSVLDKIDSQLFEGKPYEYILSGKWRTDKDAELNLYRFYKWVDFYNLCDVLHAIYTEYADMETCLCSDKKLTASHALMHRFKDVKGIPSNGSSACKRLHMFLRWMVRQDSPVDFGIWNNFSPADLIIPLDTHVYRMALELGLTERKTADMKTAIEITTALKKIFPHDPCKADFALYGYGVNNK
jgi:uncharacterized protein (TIGR02757 family)